MNGHDICAALGNLPEDMVAEAMKRPARSVPWLRIAACAAAVLGLLCGMIPSDPEIVTAPGILAVKVYAMEDEKITEYVLEEGVTHGRKEGWSPAMSWKPGIPVVLSIDMPEYPSEKITYEIFATAGQYLVQNEEWSVEAILHPDGSPIPDKYHAYWDVFTVSNDIEIYWQCWANNNWSYDPSYDKVYTHIKIKYEEHIIGYAVLRFDMRFRDNEPTWVFDPILIQSVYFPKIEGKYQNVSREYVENRFSEIISLDAE